MLVYQRVINKHAEQIKTYKNSSHKHVGLKGRKRRQSRNSPLTPAPQDLCGKDPATIPNILQYALRESNMAGNFPIHGHFNGYSNIL